MDQSRRAFLKRSAVLGVAGAATPFVVNLAAMGEAAAAVAPDYKALVCVFLYGGNDYANTVSVYDQPSYDAMARFRGSIAHPRAALDASVLRPLTSLPSGRQYALAPNLAPLLPIFDAGKMAVVLNVGTLVEPTTKAQYQARSVRVPPKLFSHNDQQSFWQASSPEGARSGWGGRLGDLFQSGNGSANLTCITAGGNAVFLSGQSAVQYATGVNGPTALLNNATSVYSSAAAATALRGFVQAPRAHMLENEHTIVGKRALDTQGQISSALAAAPALTTPFATGGLNDQLKIVARLISVSQQLGAKRQVFFVSAGGFDNHDNLVANHANLMTTVGNAMAAFYNATVELGVADRVTAFTASDFGRTMTANATGSDHGWGAHHFVVGGAVKGRRFYGTPPEVADNGPNDVGQGRLLPGIAVDQYAGTLASWFGVTASQMSTVLPNSGNFGQTGLQLGFV